MIVAKVQYHLAQPILLKVLRNENVRFQSISHILLSMSRSISDFFEMKLYSLSASKAWLYRFDGDLFLISWICYVPLRSLSVFVFISKFRDSKTWKYSRKMFFPIELITKKKWRKIKSNSILHGPALWCGSWGSSHAVPMSM